MVITATPSNSTLHHLQTFNSQNNNNNHLRDASFSSYLNNKEETFTSNRKDPLYQGAKKEEDEEIGVFGAEKYFHGGELGSPRVAKIDAIKYLHQKKEETAQETTRRYKVQYGTPSVRSESSMNSQSALLQSAVKNSSRNSKSKAQRKSFLASLGCKCYCSDKNAVEISDHAAGEISFNKTAAYGAVHGKRTTKKLINTDLDSNHSAKTTKPHAEAEFFIKKEIYLQKPDGVGILNRENDLGFSIVSPSLGIQPVKVQLQQVEKPRKSLEVFGSPVLDNMSKTLSFDRRLGMPSLESANSVGNFDEDAASDASSDLFEIDSFTGKSNPFLAKSASNIASGCASPTTCYAPSEASIAWSVVTASAVEFDDQRSVATIRSPIRTSSCLTSSNAKPKTGKEMQRRHPGKLLGCTSQKAVGVAVDAFTTYEKPGSTPQIRRKSDMFPQATKLQGGAKEENFGAKHGQQVYAKRSPSPHASSQLLYI